MIDNILLPLQVTCFNCRPGLLLQLGDLVQLVRGQLSRMQRAVLSALIVIEVHAKDVVLNLVEQNVTGINAFEWISQLRFLLFFYLVFSIILMLTHWPAPSCLQILLDQGGLVHPRSERWVSVRVWVPRQLRPFGHHPAHRQVHSWSDTQLIFSFFVAPFTSFSFSDATWPLPELSTWSLEGLRQVQPAREKPRPLRTWGRLWLSRRSSLTAPISWTSWRWASFWKGWLGEYCDDVEQHKSLACLLSLSFPGPLVCSSGAWACFDEFNRIDVEVLSVVAQQVATIHKAQMERVRSRFNSSCYRHWSPTFAESRWDT